MPRTHQIVWGLIFCAPYAYMFTRVYIENGANALLASSVWDLVVWIAFWFVDREWSKPKRKQQEA